MVSCFPARIGRTPHHLRFDGQKAVQTRPLEYDTAVARMGEKLAAADVKASNEDKGVHWFVRNAVDGNVDKPDSCWLTRRTSSKRAWVELRMLDQDR